MTGSDWDGVADAVDAALADFDTVIANVNQAIRERVPEYAYVSDEQLTIATTRNIGLIFTALRERRYLRDHELADFEATVEERARNGVPVDEYLLAVATAEASAWDQLWEYAGSVPIERRLEAFALRFANVTAVDRVTTKAHRRIELVTAREENARRSLALRALLRGEGSAADRQDHFARLGLDSTRSYFVVRARGRSKADSDQVQQVLGNGFTHAPHVAFALWGDDIVGLLIDRPFAGLDVVAGYAGPVCEDELAVAHEHATLAFETAWRLGLTEAHDLGSLGLKAAVHAQHQFGEQLRAKYVVPIRESGGLGEELLTTVRAYLEQGGSRDAVAAQLHVHSNTVGYRVGRFVELTGADLADLATLAELWWLFTDLDLRGYG
ncbi:MAG TPA: helix-turn-helix domain-containing protein [Mycobacteriales bacterium]|nr:helix-turn-helix domain-containing protein [Mycobacteriales bacterium]